MGGPPPPPPPGMNNPPYRGPPPPMPMGGGYPQAMPPPPPPQQFGALGAPIKTGSKKPVDEAKVDRLMERIRKLEEENDDLKDTHGITKKPPRFQVFHRIEGDSMTYLEPPTWELRGDDEFRLKGQLPITSQDRYLQNHKDIVFYIERDYSKDPLDEDNKKAERQGAALPEPKPEYETIRLETDEMIDAAEEFSDLQENFRDDFPEMNNLMNPIKAPYLFWYRYRKPNAFDDLEPRHQELMTLLTGWIEENYLAEYEKADALFQSGMVTKDVMQYLVRPSDVVVRKESGAYQAFLSTSWTRTKSVSAVKEKWDSFKNNDGEGSKAPLHMWFVTAWGYGFDGDFFKATTFVDFELRVEKGDEEVKITELNAFPLRFADESIRKKLEKRGKTFWSCRVKKLVSYQEEGEEAALGTGERYMIDYATYRQLHPDSAIAKRVVERAYIPEKIMKMDEAPDAPKCYLMPTSIVGYNLRRKKWVDMEVDRICEVVWNKLAFEHLVVEAGTKDLVQALVTNQIAAEKSTDLISNKGNGLVMLLHGGPGTGKTFTAESVAELAEKPLFRVTCGDIGTQAQEVEKYLESVLYLGRIWGAVVLLDEADVFLEQRTLNDLQRNALVSVFLRVLEYYDGILLLTSNRVGTFDEAFKSRIQLALHYEPLNRPQRSQIWANFFNRLKGLGESNIDYYDVEGYISILADHEMNGRQIRNAITTARQLAQFQGKDMSYEHLKHVITVASKFDRHLSTLRSGTPEEGNVRDDETTMSKYTWADWKKLTVDDPNSAGEKDQVKENDSN
ncbi:P-loop containing nucleoside triphosphate hydrolase protein [Microthyrium microscopicum]|uniref:P-loop containing nucleoside triphosphate hydrolase protein n=1 Tax=Microthyrium microscopicum TaxID=703497 RepID=A0A6A6UNH6_9PEZI|nr:P-loop containing nucleoside triphosphate hydrolase protein [Microthyrium microscopicum]